MRGWREGGAPDGHPGGALWRQRHNRSEAGVRDAEVGRKYRYEAGVPCRVSLALNAHAAG